MPQAQRFADMGFTVIWLPPPTTSVAPQGYMPLDYYNLNSAYGTEEELRTYALFLIPIHSLSQSLPLNSHSINT